VRCRGFGFAQGDLVGLGYVVGLDGSQPLAQALRRSRIRSAAPGRRDVVTMYSLSTTLRFAGHRAGG